MMVKIRFGRSLSEPLGLRSLIPSLAWLSVDELRAVVTGYPSAFQALSPLSSMVEARKDIKARIEATEN
jgi:hypothetical protein